ALALPAAAAGTLPAASDLAREAAAMRREATPMAILYSQHGCAWCDIARSQLVPMSRDADVGAIFRQIDIDRATPMTAFDGEPTRTRTLRGPNKRASRRCWYSMAPPENGSPSP